MDSPIYSNSVQVLQQRAKKEINKESINVNIVFVDRVELSSRVRLLNVHHLGNVNVASIGDCHRVDGFTLGVHFDEMERRLLGWSKELNSIVVVISDVKNAVVIHAALERISKHARFLSVAQSKSAFKVEGLAIVHYVVGDDAVICRIADKQSVVEGAN